MSKFTAPSSESGVITFFTGKFISKLTSMPRGGAGSNVTQHWMPAQHSSEAGPHSRGPPATNNRPDARQAVVPSVSEGGATRDRAMEAAVEAMLSTGGETMLQLLNNSGHQEVASMLSVEGPGASTQK